MNPRRYEWERWFRTGKRVMLLRGRHYPWSTSQSSIVQQARNAARRLELKVRIEDLDDRIVITTGGTDGDDTDVCVPDVPGS